MADRLADFYQEYGRQLTIWFEPGKYLVSEAGFLVTRVNVVKHTVANVFAGVDSGLNHLIRPMMYDAYHRILNLTNPDGSPRIYSVVGYICETDTFAQDRKLPEIRSGDLLAICNAGAYCMSMASNYNCRYRPAEVLLLDGAAHLIRQEEGLEQLLQNQIEIEL
jgi:diaminopimelate decarboxylase